MELIADQLLHHASCEFLPCAHESSAADGSHANCILKARGILSGSCRKVSYLAVIQSPYQQHPQG
jgi:hypothetical protein